MPEAIKSLPMILIALVALGLLAVFLIDMFFNVKLARGICELVVKMIFGIFGSGSIIGGLSESLASGVCYFFPF
jgi:hypothetical protein